VFLVDCLDIVPDDIDPVGDVSWGGAASGQSYREAQLIAVLPSQDGGVVLISNARLPRALPALPVHGHPSLHLAVLFHHLCLGALLKWLLAGNLKLRRELDAAVELFIHGAAVPSATAARKRGRKV